MIQITVYKNKKHEYVGFDTEGHADFSESGQDIVCAAVSALVINLVNSIERLTSDRTCFVSDEKEGKIEFRFLDVPSHDAQLLLGRRRDVEFFGDLFYPHDFKILVSEFRTVHLDPLVD